MSFTRGIDPKDSMEIGRKKEAFTLISVKIHSNNNEMILTDPYVIEKFLNDFSKFSIPNDPIFGPQRIVFRCREKIREYGISALMRSTMLGLSPISQDTEMREVEREVDKLLGECEGKTVIFNEKMYAIPSFKELKENGFEHLQICERNQLNKEEEERKRASEVMAIQYEHMKKMAQIFNPVIRPPSSDGILVNTDPIAIYADEKPKVIKKKRKKFLIFDIETRIR